MSKREPFQSFEALGLHTDFALTSSNNEFVQVYDMKAPEMYPDLFYLPPPPPEPVVRRPAHRQKTWKETVQEETALRIWLAGLSFVGLFVLYRCVSKSS